MKHFKLFMMLALLVMGVSNVCAATKDYFVNYEREFLGNDAGYTITQGTYTKITKFGDLTSTLGDGISEVGDRMIRVESNYISYFESNVTDYIKAKPITGYNTRVVLIENCIYICYIWSDAYNSVSSDGTINLKTSVLTNHEWTPTGSNFTYSDLYVKTDSRRVKNVIKLPAEQCAVRLNTYTQTEVTIPVTDSQKGYDVVAIQTHGMDEKVEHRIPAVGCNYPSASTTEEKDYFTYSSPKNDFYNDWSNSSLTTVNFSETSKVRSIGDYAFCSCKALTTIEIPQSVEYLGEAAFSMCVGLRDGLTFERNSDGTLEGNIKVIRNYTFNYCINMTDLELPEGIIVIEGQQAGAAMQYMENLINLRLPNTLVAVGPHFLCDAGSLRTVTIPASVRYIDGAAFHGCESLKEVYLMGPASALQASYTGSQTATTFEANETLCKNHMTQCVFITTQDNIRGYVEDPNGVWQWIADNKGGKCQADVRELEVNEKTGGIKTDENGNFVYKKDANGNYVNLKYSDGTTVQTKADGETVCSQDWGNALTFLSDQKVRFTPGKWTTVIFPKAYTNAELKSTFGDEVVLAKMTGFADPESSVVNGKLIYHLKFEAQQTAKANTPYMIKPGRKAGDSDYDVTLIASNEMKEAYREEMNKDHALSIQAGDDSHVVMYGWFRRIEKMKQWEFYFMNPANDKGEWNTNCQFKRIKDPAKAPAIKAFRCYWRIWLKGEVQDAGADAGAKTGFFTFVDDDQTTGIEQVDSNVSIEIGSIYDLNGRKLDLKKEDLPKGLFIIDGKKVMVK